jgi:hypothetical protein
MLDNILCAAKPLIEVARFNVSFCKRAKKERLVGLRIWAKKCHSRFGNSSNDA